MIYDILYVSFILEFEKKTTLQSVFIAKHTSCSVDRFQPVPLQPLQLCSAVPLCFRQFSVWISVFSPPCPGAVSAFQRYQSGAAGHRSDKHSKYKPTEQPRALTLPLHGNTFDASSWTRNAVDSCSVKNLCFLPCWSHYQAKSKIEQPGEKISPVKGCDMQEGFSSSKHSCRGSAWFKYCSNEHLHFPSSVFGFQPRMPTAPKEGAFCFVHSHLERGWWKTQAPARELGESETLWNRNGL